MPVLKFQLRSRRLILDASPAIEEWQLVFDAISQPVRNGQSFKIRYSRGKQYDAYAIEGTAYVRSRAATSEQASPEQNLGIGSVVVIHPSEDWGETSPFFEAKFLLSADTFRRLIETDNISRVVELWVTTAMRENGLIYGNDPDGRELEWWPERSNTSVVESISIRFIEP